MKKCEVLAERVTLVVNKGSIVIVDDVQAETARALLKPVEEKAQEKPVERPVELPQEQPVEEKKTKKTKKK